MTSNKVFIGITAVGTAGVLIPILNLIGNSQPEVQIGIMISGSIIFGAGVIATVIAQKK